MQFISVAGRRAPLALGSLRARTAGPNTPGRLPLLRGALLLAAALSAASTPGPAPAEGVTSRVERVGGLPTFVVDGRPQSGVCYSTYDCDPERLRSRAAAFSEAGCGIFNFVVEISGYGFSRPTWVARNRWDFSDLDLRATTILQAAPAALLLPRIYIDAPRWWMEENPGELMVLSNGAAGFGRKLFALPRAEGFASLASERWRSDMGHALETVIDHIERSPYGSRVLGYQLSGQKTEEWYHWSMNAEPLGDYSQHMLRAFRRWLRARYGSDEALAAAWARPGATLDAVEIPSEAERFGDRSRTFRDPARERPVMDFQEFWSDVMADTIAFFAGVAKRKLEGKKIVGAFYGYTFEFNDLIEDAGHLALGRLMRSPHVDFVMAPSSYYNRNLPGTPFFRAPVASLNLHGKVFWNDFDQVSYKYREKVRENPALKQWEYQMGLTETAEEFVWMNRREVGMELAQGAQLAHFDIHGGYYDDTEILRGVRDLIALREEALRLPYRTSNAQILAIFDERSVHFLTFRNPLLTPLVSGTLAQLGFTAPYDAILLSDLENLATDRYRLIIFLNAVLLDDAQRALIRGRLARDGRTILWLHAPGYSRSGATDPTHMQNVTGIQIEPDAESPRGGRARFVSLGPSSRADGPPPEAAGSPPEATGDGPGLEAPLILGDPFCVRDSAAETLAVRTEPGRSDRVVVASRRLDGWRSVYSASAPLPATVLRRLAREAGAHLYTRSPDVLVFANRDFLTLGAPDREGEYEVDLPEPRNVLDAFTKEEIGLGVRSFRMSLRPKEVRVLLLR